LFPKRFSPRRPRIHVPLPSSGPRRLALAGAVLLALAAAPFALAAGEGSTLRGGARNPTSNPSVSYIGETQIIATNSTYGTRQSNKGTGGGAIYGCRSVTTGPACLAGVNLNTGRAFSFTSGGNVGGEIILSNKSGAPLTTNATGVATGFNANYLQGKQANEFVQTGQLLFATVTATGKLEGAARGATALEVNTEKTIYKITFGTTNLSKCSATASPSGKALTAGSLGVEVSTTNPAIVEVSAPSGFAQGFHVQVIC
jgi:hypothetical protein